MQFKVIDSKMKEIYYTSVPVCENKDADEAIGRFWTSMNVIGIQNMSVQRVKAA